MYIHAHTTIINLLKIIILVPARPRTRFAEGVLQKWHCVKMVYTQFNHLCWWHPFSTFSTLRKTWIRFPFSIRHVIESLTSSHHFWTPRIFRFLIILLCVCVCVCVCAKNLHYLGWWWLVRHGPCDVPFPNLAHNSSVQLSLPHALDGVPPWLQNVRTADTILFSCTYTW